LGSRRKRFGRKIFYEINMRNLTLILFVVALLNLSCVQPQKFEPDLTIKNTDKNQQSVDVSATPTNAPIFIISEKQEVLLQKKGKPELLGTTSETEKLRKSFTDLLKEKEDKTVFVRTSRSVKYGEVAVVLDLLKSAGAKPIGLEIKDLEQ
jgi:biopolymer transport protein ExbD